MSGFCDKTLKRLRAVEDANIQSFLFKIASSRKGLLFPNDQIAHDTKQNRFVVLTKILQVFNILKSLQENTIILQTQCILYLVRYGEQGALKMLEYPHSLGTWEGSWLWPRHLGFGKKNLHVPWSRLPSLIRAPLYSFQKTRSPPYPLHTRVHTHTRTHPDCIVIRRIGLQALQPGVRDKAQDVSW